MPLYLRIKVFYLRILHMLNLLFCYPLNRASRKYLGVYVGIDLYNTVQVVFLGRPKPNKRECMSKKCRPYM